MALTKSSYSELLTHCSNTVNFQLLHKHLGETPTEKMQTI